MTEPLLSLRSVTLSLGEPPTRILRGIDFAIRAGETVAVLGPSGSGKSSLMAVASGIERPTGGSVRLAGEELTDLGEDRLARLRGRTLGMVLQAFHLMPTMSALENVALPLELMRAPGARSRARDELEAVGLGHRVGHYPSQLSGGEQQRVAIARALVTRPVLLMADEPTGNLDSETGARIIDLLFDRAEAAGAGALVITHDPAVAARCGRVAHMADGRLSEPAAQ